jgi:hypothetical protein
VPGSRSRISDVARGHRRVPVSQKPFLGNGPVKRAGELWVVRDRKEDACGMSSLRREPRHEHRDLDASDTAGRHFDDRRIASFCAVGRRSRRGGTSRVEDSGKDPNRDEWDDLAAAIVRRKRPCDPDLLVVSPGTRPYARRGARRLGLSGSVRAGRRSTARRMGRAPSPCTCGRRFRFRERRRSSSVPLAARP